MGYRDPKGGGREDSILWGTEILKVVARGQYTGEYLDPKGGGREDSILWSTEIMKVVGDADYVYLSLHCHHQDDFALIWSAV